MNIKRRLLEFIDYLHMGQNAFEKNVGFSIGTLSRVKSIGSEKIALVFNKYPELNLYWLILGQGEMILKESETTQDENLVLMTKILLQKEKEIEVLKQKIILFESRGFIYNNDNTIKDDEERLF